MPSLKKSRIRIFDLWLKKFLIPEDLWESLDMIVLYIDTERTYNLKDFWIQKVVSALFDFLSKIQISLYWLKSEKKIIHINLSQPLEHLTQKSYYSSQKPKKVIFQ